MCPLGSRARDLAALAAANPGRDDDTRVVGGTWSTACYITDSLPALLFLGHKYAAAPPEKTVR